MGSKLTKTMCAVGAASLVLSIGDALGAQEFNETVLVRPDSASEEITPQLPEGGIPPYLVDNGDGTSTVYTLTAVNAGEARVTSAGGGITLETTGDGTLESGTREGFTYIYDKVTKVIVDNDTGEVKQQDIGDGPVNETYYGVAAELDEETGEVVSLQELAPLENQVPDGELDYDSLPQQVKPLITTPLDPVEAGGNLTVAGDVSVGGELMVENGVQNADGTSLIHKGDDGSVHIGENSLVTNEVDGEQQLYAEDGAGDPIDINVTNGSGLKVDGETVAKEKDVADEAVARADADDAIKEGAGLNDDGSYGPNSDANYIAEAESLNEADVILDGQVKTNETAIAQEVADRIALIRRNEEDGMLHIGDDSIVTGVVDGEQVLRAQKTGEDIDLRINGDTNLVVDNELAVKGKSNFHDTLSVRPEDSSSVEVVEGGDTELPSIVNDETTSTVFTQTGSVLEERVDSAGGGVTLDTNGNATLARAAVEGVEYEYLQVTAFDVYNPGHPEAGEPVPGTVRRVGGYKDAETGQFVMLGELDEEGLLNVDSLTEEQKAVIATSMDMPEEGGNLMVGGNATVKGQLQANNGVVDAEGENLISKDADGAVHIGSNSLVTQEVGGQQLLYAEDGTGNPIDIRVTNDSNLTVDGTTLTGDLNVVTDAAVGNDLTVGNNATVAGTTTTNDLEVVNNASVGNDLVVSNDAMIGNDIAVANNAAVANDLDVGNNANVSSDLTVGNNAQVSNDLAVGRNASVGQDLQISRDAAVGRSLYVTDDVYVGGRTEGLQSQIDRNRGHIEDNADDIDTNRRGIAMVAAMTNTKIEPGKKQALDYNISYFEGEAGLGIGYGYRINDMMQLNFAGSSTFDFEEAVGRVGISMQW